MLSLCVKKARKHENNESKCIIFIHAYQSSLLVPASPTLNRRESNMFGHHVIISTLIMNVKGPSVCVLGDNALSVHLNCQFNLSACPLCESWAESLWSSGAYSHQYALAAPWRSAPLFCAESANLALMAQTLCRTI